MIIDCTDVRWNGYLSQMPFDKQDIYYTSQYYQIEQMNGNGIGQMLVYEDGNNIGLYPFIKKNIINGNLIGKYYDIQTAYGYGGPIVKERDNGFEQKFEQFLVDYCKKECIVAEFIRFHPLFKNEHIFKQNIQVTHNRNTIWLNLDLSLEEIWMSEITKKNRNTIRKSIKSGLYVEVGEDYSEFISIYNETMKKVKAEDFYYFNKNYYECLESNKDTILLYVKQEEKTLAAAIFIGYGEYFHYHLSGSRKEYLKLSPNNILLWEAIKYAKQHGYKKMHFGGGLTDSMEDSLYCFKKKFSSTQGDYYIGKRIHDKKIYDLLIREWEEKHHKKAKLFLQYRE